MTRRATRLFTTFASLLLLTTALTQAETITGTVRKVTDSTAIASAKVYLVSNNVRTDSTTTDALGEYTLEVASTGFLTLQAEFDGYAIGSGNAFFFNGATEATVNFYLGNPGAITGTVRKLSDSTALANALVLLRQGNSDNSTILDSARTDANGAYTFDGLSPSNTGGFGGSNPYRVYASADGMVSASVTGLNVALSDTIVTNFYLGASATISGTVRKSSDNSVLEGANVSLRRGSATGTVIDSKVTDAQGHYEFTAVAPGAPNYWISASDSGLATATNANIVVGSGATVVSDLSLAGILPGSISGTVRKAADSTVVAGAMIYLRRGNANSEILDSAISGVNGTFAFDELEAGTPNYFLTVSSTLLATVTVSNVVVPNGNNVVANAYLPTLGGINGTVRKLTDSTAIQNALVLLRRGTSDESEILDSVRTDANGAYAFTNLTASTTGGFGGNATQYRVYASATGLALASNTGISVQNGVMTTSNLYLGAPGSISGTIRALSDSTPVANALVELQLSNGFFGTFVDSIRTNANGYYTFTNITPGETYQINVTAEGYVSANVTNIDVASGVDASADLALELVARGSISGMVSKASDSSAIANAWVVIRRGSETATIIDSVRTDSTGRYSFSDLVAGMPNYWVTASAAGYDPVTNADVSVAGDDTTTSDFALSVVVSIGKGVNAAQQSFTATRVGNAWLIRLPAATTTRIFTMHTVSGALLHRTVVPAGRTEITVPAAATRTGILMRLQ